MTRPVLLKGLKVHPDNPLRLDFILSPGDSGLKGAALQAEGRRLIKDFLAALTLPEASLWVNLSPYERHRIIADGLDRTAMGRDLLQEDYELKQLTAMSLHPEREPGRSYWARVYREAYDIYGTTRLPFQSRHRVWIVPDTVTFYEGGLGVFIVDSRMKVLTEGEYRGRRREAGEDERSGRLRRLGEEVLKEVVLPRIEEEVNHGPRFARLRQIYQAMLLADWYKEHLRKTILGRIYVDRSKLGGVDDVDRSEKERIFEAYLAAFRRGVYDFLREDVEPVSGRKIPRRYFSGGFTWRKPRKIEAATPPPGEDLVLAEGVLNPVAAGPGKASSALQAVEGILSDRKIKLVRPLKDMERRERISFLLALLDRLTEGEAVRMVAEAVGGEILHGSLPGGVVRDLSVTFTALLAQKAGVDSSLKPLAVLWARRIVETILKNGTMDLSHKEDTVRRVFTVLGGLGEGDDFWALGLMKSLEDANLQEIVTLARVIPYAGSLEDLRASFPVDPWVWSRHVRDPLVEQWRREGETFGEDRLAAVTNQVRMKGLPREELTWEEFRRALRSGRVMAGDIVELDLDGNKVRLRVNETGAALQGYPNPDQLLRSMRLQPSSVRVRVHDWKRLKGRPYSKFRRVGFADWLVGKLESERDRDREEPPPLLIDERWGRRRAWEYIGTDTYHEVFRGEIDGTPVWVRIARLEGVNYRMEAWYFQVLHAIGVGPKPMFWGFLPDSKDARRKYYYEIIEAPRGEPLISADRGHLLGRRHPVRALRPEALQAVKRLFSLLAAYGIETKDILLYPQKIWVDGSSEDSIAWMTDPAGIMLDPPELSRDRARLSDRLRMYWDFFKDRGSHPIWDSLDPHGELVAFLEQERDTYRSGGTAGLVGDWTDKALSDRELGEMRGLVPAWDWASASTVTWAELVRDPAREPRPKDALQERYFKNSVEVRRAFLELMRDLASAQKKGESVPLEGFKKRWAAINRIAVLGESGTSYYVRRVPSGRELEEWAKEVAGTYRPGEDLDRRLETVLWALQRFIAVSPGRYRSNEDFLILADIYLAFAPDYSRGQNFFFLTANNSMVMNLINTLLRLHGYHKGIPHEEIDISLAPLRNRTLLQMQFQQMVREVNSGRDEPRAGSPIEEPSGEKALTAPVSEEELAQWEKDFPDLNWRHALFVPWREVVHDPAAQPRPENPAQEWYWRNHADTRTSFLRMLVDLQRNPEMDVDDFRSRLAEVHAALLIGLEAAEKLVEGHRSLRLEEIKTPYLMRRELRADTLTEKEIERGKTDALISAERYRLWVAEDEGRERLGDLLQALRRVLALPKEKFGTEEDIHAILAVYQASLPRASGEYFFLRGNNSFFMNLVNALLRLHGFRSGISHGHLDSRFLPKDALTDSAARPMEERFLEMVRERNRRASSAATDSVGGIDLNPAVLRRKTVGGGIEMNPDFDPRSLERMPIEGFAPVILRVVPLPDLPMFLGAAGEDGTDSTTLSLAPGPERPLKEPAFPSGLPPALGLPSGEGNRKS